VVFQDAINLSAFLALEGKEPDLLLKSTELNWHTDCVPIKVKDFLWASPQTRLWHLDVKSLSTQQTIELLRNNIIFQGIN